MNAANCSRFIVSVSFLVGCLSVTDSKQVLVKCDMFSVALSTHNKGFGFAMVDWVVRRAVGIIAALLCNAHDWQVVAE